MSILQQILAESRDKFPADVREGLETIKHVNFGMARVTDLGRDGAVRCWRVVRQRIAEVATLKNGEWSECHKHFPSN